MGIAKMDNRRRIKLPPEIRRMYSPGQVFTVEVKDNAIVLRPVKKITVELDDGTVIEANI